MQQRTIVLSLYIFLDTNIIAKFKKKENVDRKQFETWEVLKHSPHERGKAGGHEPQHFPLLCHILAFYLLASYKPQPFGFPCHTFESSGNYYVFK